MGSANRNRNLLHLTKIEDFAYWCALDGLVRVAVNQKHGYEVLRLTGNGNIDWSDPEAPRVLFPEHVWVFYQHKGGEHATVSDRNALKAVERYILANSPVRPQDGTEEARTAALVLLPPRTARGPREPTDDPRTRHGFTAPYERMDYERGVGLKTGTTTGRFAGGPGPSPHRAQQVRR